MQVALVPHTDRTSAFYLAMIRAAEAVGGLVRSASRPEMALLVAGGALAKGAPLNPCCSFETIETQRALLIAPPPPPPAVTCVHVYQLSRAAAVAMCQLLARSHAACCPAQ